MMAWLKGIPLAWKGAVALVSAAAFGGAILLQVENIRHLPEQVDALEERVGGVEIQQREMAQDIAVVKCITVAKERGESTTPCLLEN